MRRTVAVFAVLREHLAAQLTEIELCRTRLAAVLEPLRAEEPVEPSADDWLLPPHCTSLADAARALAITADDVRELDERVQYLLTESAGGLARACLTGTDLPRLLGPMSGRVRGKNAGGTAASDCGRGGISRSASRR